MDLDRIARADYHFGMSALRDAREAAGLTQSRLADLAGTSQPQIRRLEAGEREFTKQWAERLAPFLNRSAKDLLFSEAGQSELVRTSSDLVPVSVSGVAEAGAFREANEFVEFERVTIFEPRDAKFPNARQLAFDVEGDSMNDLKPRPIMPGDRVICVDFDDLEGRVPLRDGMVVVVEQERDGGHLREWSVKQVELYDDRIEFCPRSINPKHKPIVIARDPKADNGLTVRVLALVRRITNEVPLS
ncbi:helix-turn-helix domain-containing protein [Hansschlegelia sp.]|uniref:helix-turn-helix domain-containing protein n=1 Tax=Hansschlegelia sp. TaxID=2041892 RepID=UPI002D80F68A|nr:helix-turn-helix domain-containing protein [Hansschlegelia sp.]